MKITNSGFVDSGAGTAGFRAYKENLSLSESVNRWRRAKRNSLWIKAAIRAFREAGGVVPGKKIN
jgi:hypothetical protein|nr:hypothetical protein [uncultured Mediterranean phage uvMED]